MKSLKHRASRQAKSNQLRPDRPDPSNCNLPCTCRLLPSPERVGQLVGDSVMAELTLGTTKKKPASQQYSCPSHRLRLDRERHSNFAPSKFYFATLTFELIETTHPCLRVAFTRLASQP